MKQIYLCQPYSYGIEPEALESRKRACDGFEHIYPDSGEWDVFQTDIRSTMLCESFNLGVASAKNGQADYFGMIHSDMAAPAGWLPTQIKAMESVGADMIHAVARIKDDRGLSSTAYSNSLDPWSLKRRLTLKEINQLPDVFTLADIQRQIDPEAKVLLPNPGCMVMKCGKWFQNWRGFNTLSDVIRKEDGKYWTRSVSEDYVFGYWAAANGLKLAAVGPRLVPTQHVGRKLFNSATLEGFECDRDYFIATGKPPVGEGRWVFPAEVDGWLTMPEAKALTRLAYKKRVLEIGSYCGKSTICMAQVADNIVAVDPHDGRGTDRPRNTMMTMLANLARYQVGNVTVEMATSSDWAATYDGESFDLVFVDAAHDYDSVKADIDVAMRFVRPDGVIALHDYRKVPREHDGGWDPGVTQAVDEFVAANGFELEQAGTVAIVRAGVLQEAT